jgi:selenide, water dikinase
LADLPVEQDPNLIVGTGTSDDAGVYKISDTLALIQTVDFFTPIVDDPYQFGRIAAANALSDVYAMGGRPLTAMNIVCFPAKEMDKAILKQILKGGVEIIHEAGAVLAGGHSVEDPEIKYGLSVTGLVHPDKVLTNAGSQPGDSLVLTKPLGTGIITTAIKAGMAPAGLEEKIIGIMAALNKRAAESMENFHVNACTDITGFGLLGHTLEMAQASRVEIHLMSREVPMLPEALEFAAMGLVPEGTHANRNFCANALQTSPDLDEVLLDVLADAQTSGGLLISTPQGEALCRALQENGVPDSRIIGKVAAKHQKGFLKVF